MTDQTAVVKNIFLYHAKRMLAVPPRRRLQQGPSARFGRLEQEEAQVAAHGFRQSPGAGGLENALQRRLGLGPDDAVLTQGREAARAEQNLTQIVDRHLQALPFLGRNVRADGRGVAKQLGE